VESSVTFGVESSVPIKGTFEKWDAKMTFTSTDVRSGVLEVNIEADSVNTGSGMKNNKLKGKDFFDTQQSPMITFKSTKVVQTGPNTFDLEGDFTIRGVTKTEKLTVTDNGKGTSSGSITGTMAFDRKDYGMNKGIPFIRIANRVEVNINLKWNRVSKVHIFKYVSVSASWLACWNARHIVPVEVVGRRLEQPTPIASRRIMLWKA
jgi:polyisoprenoid-binding protein YceI